jgi:hypothetical protein
MTGEQQGSPAQITLIQVIAISDARGTAEHTHQRSLEDPQESSLKLVAAPLEAQSYPGIIASEHRQSRPLGTDPIEFPVLEALPARSSQVRAPTQDESISSLVPSDRGGFRVGLVTSVVIGALCLCWAGLSNPYGFLKSESAPTGLQQTAALDRIAPAVDQDKSAGAQDDHPVFPRTGTDPDRHRSGSEPAPSADQAIVIPSNPEPLVGQKPTAFKPPAAVPREKTARYKLTPTPDTRPDTLAGWKVREVLRGAAVLQGPDGIRKVSVGDTVPGAGRIDSIVRWGSRWIVATSRGLITTD